MARPKLVFICYECDIMFSKFDYMRTHELFVHGHIVQNCQINTENQKKLIDQIRHEKQLEQKRERYQKNKEYHKHWYAQYYQKHRQERLEYMKNWYESNKVKKVTVPNKTF